MTQDQEHLKLLSVFHYVVAGLAGLFSLFPIFHLVFGLIIIFAPQVFEQSGDTPPAFMGWFMVVFAVIFIPIGLAFAALILMAGRCIVRRRRYMFCLVMAGIECLFVPFGTVLGVFTIIVLMRESVKEMFTPAGISQVS
ncbi:MAG: hypothetical protein IT445_06000 [Phycisphaeraceae bacterium]|nr:hypothetical protein [Phycisphaeraceae bacterium]